MDAEGPGLATATPVAEYDAEGAAIARPPAVLFYDGGCGLCHGTVRFLLAIDQEGRACRFAPLGGETFLTLVPEEARTALPDSLVLRTSEGALLTRSTAVLEVLRAQRHLWRWLAIVLGLIPTLLRDAVYDFVARVRHRLFRRPDEACPLLPPHLRARFDP